MTPLITLGIDPGKRGAMAALDSTGGIVWVDDMPSLTGSAIGAWLVDRLANESVAVAWVEKVHAMPKQGVSSVWTFAEGFGALLGGFGALRVPVRFVAPNVWKKAAGLSPDKDGARQRASERWPGHAGLFARRCDDGRAEACLIGLHGLVNG